MVEKRILTLIVLATLVWALITSGLAAYYYLEMSRYQRESDERQHLLLGIAEGCKKALERQDLLMRDYNALLGEYYMFMEENYSMFVEKYVQLLFNLGSNFTATINGSLELGEAYKNLMNTVQELKGHETVTRDEFEPLLMKFNGLLRSIVAKELKNVVGKNTIIKVNLCIDYGNGTAKWHNVSTILGVSLFDLTRQVAQIEYDYYPLMEPGHVLVKTIDGVTQSPSELKYWFWYYWDDTANQWVFGQMGCDAWVLRDNGTYKWAYKAWGEP